MRTFWSFLAKIFIVVAVVQAWFVYDLYQKNQALTTANSALTSQLQAAEAALNETNQRVAALEKQSLEGMLQETNKAVISGWETLLDTVRDELEKAKDAIPSLLGETEPDESSTAEQGPSPSEQQAPAADPKSAPEFAPSVEGERT
ncbi:MAG: hypothetical protein AAFZ92_08270 [Pseudomonadota bacterium]